MELLLTVLDIKFPKTFPPSECLLTTLSVLQVDNQVEIVLTTLVQDQLFGILETLRAFEKVDYLLSEVAIQIV